MSAQHSADRPPFDDYVMVDWSANNTPKRGADSIWLAHLRQNRSRLRRLALKNFPTRHLAELYLQDLLSCAVQAGRRMLVGFDFANAYPAGFADKAGFDTPHQAAAWRRVWDGLAGLIRDAADNRNNRFAVAAGLNKRVAGGGFPFWGRPVTVTDPYLPARKPQTYGPETLPERRLCEAYLPRTQPCWKLYTTGAVGSQSLMGIPVLQRLRDDPQLSPHCRVWPFETGLAPPPAQRPLIILAEVYPSLIPDSGTVSAIKDARQVDNIARFFAHRGRHGQLAQDFCGPQDLSRQQRRVICNEEGWILGAGTVSG